MGSEESPQRHTHRYRGDVITIQLGSIVIRATGNHPFYVLRGERLASRPLPEDVPEAERRAAASPLLSWLERNGYEVDAAAGRVLDAYTRKNRAFTAESVRITLYVIADSTVSSSNLPTTPLVFRETIPGRMGPVSYTEERVRETTGGGGRGLAVLWKGEHQPLADLRTALEGLMKGSFPVGAAMYLTRLELALPP